MVTEPPQVSKIFLDSSVLFAAFISSTGASRAILLLGEIGLVKLVVTQQVFDEVSRNLAIKSPRSLPLFERLVKEIEWKVETDPDALLVESCASVIARKDAPILAAAMNVRPARFITLDQQHFLTPAVKEFSHLNIQTPSQFIAEIRSLLSGGLLTSPE